MVRTGFKLGSKAEVVSLLVKMIEVVEGNFLLKEAWLSRQKQSRG